MSADPGALIGRVAKGDKRAFAELYDELAPTVYGIVQRVVRDPAQSEEITREVFVELWRHAARFDPAPRCRAFLGRDDRSSPRG